MARSSLIRSPEALTYMSQGFDKLASLLALTLGPGQGSILSGSMHAAPEVLQDAATIARRIVALPNRGEDAGAMLLRNMVWGVRERYGDGAATASVLAQAIVHEASTQIAAGANPMAMRRGIERGVAAVSHALAEQVVPARGQALLARLAASVTGDPELGAVLGEMFDLLGTDAALLVEEFAAPYLDHEYLDGGRWRARTAARDLMPEGRELTLEHPLVLVIDQKLEHIVQVQAALELAALAPGRPPLLLVAREITGEALRALTINHARGVLTIGAAIVTTGPALADDLGDIAALTGAQVLTDVLGRPPQRVQPHCFGRARRTILNREYLTLLGGDGRAAMQARVAGLRGELTHINRDHANWKRLKMRVARLSQGVGILKIGASTPRERTHKKEQAEKALRVLEAALDEGLVPGGGVAFLNCRCAVQAVRQACADSDEAAGVTAVAAALDAPLRQIVCNHGVVHPPFAVAEALRLGAGYGFDTRTGMYVDMVEAGVFDSLRVARGAIEAAASAAVMAITTGVIVLASEKRRELKLQP